MSCVPAEAATEDHVTSSAADDAVDGDAEAGWRHSMTEVPPYVAVVRDRYEAQRVAHLLTTRYRACTFGADTEVRWASILCRDACDMHGIQTYCSKLL